MISRDIFRKIGLLAFGLFGFSSLSWAEGIDKKIDEVFGSATGWFVDLIFYQISFTEDVKVFWVLSV